MDFSSIVSQMVVLLIVVIAGYALHKLKLLNEKFDSNLSRLVLDVALPCQIVGSVVTATDLPDVATIWFMFGMSFLANGIVLVIAAVVPILLRAPKKARGVYSFIIAFGNVGFIGFPVLTAVFGPEAVVYGSILNIPFNLLVFTVGVLFLSDGSMPLGERLKTGAQNLKSPILVACILVLVLAPLNIGGAGVVGDALVLVGDMTTPTALLIIGSSVARIPVLTMVNNWRAWLAVLCRLLVAPVVVLAIMRLFVSDPFLLGTIVVTAGMPVATNGTLLCLRYSADFQTMLQGTSISTVLSIATIPVVVFLLSIA